MRKVAVYASTQNLYHKMAVAAKSLLTHTRMDRVVFLVESAYTESVPDIIETIDVSNQTYFPKNGPNYVSHWTYMTLMRLAIPYLLPEENTALYLDVDTLVERDISPVFDLPLGYQYMAMAMEPSRGQYYNAGVMLMNLKLLRESGMARKLINKVNLQHLRLPDQDAINELCRLRILPMHPEYNSCRFTAEPKEPRIIHFAANRAYDQEPLFQYYDKDDWRECYADV